MEAAVEVPQELETKTCPKCGNVGYVDMAFGYRLLRGEIRAQSWCKACRGAKTVMPSLSVKDEPMPVDEAGKPTSPWFDHATASQDDAITPALAQIRSIYQREFPADKAGSKRAWRFCVGKLLKRGYEFASGTAQLKWEMP